MNAFNAFVVACTPIARSEVRRLVRAGAWVDVEDAVQGALIDMLESRHLFAESPTLATQGALARIHIRHRLVTHVVQYSKAKKRTGLKVPVKEALDVGVDSHEDNVIIAVDAERLLSRCPFPDLDGGTRAGRHQRRERWKNRAHRALAQKPANDNAFIMKGAA